MNAEKTPILQSGVFSAALTNTLKRIASVTKNNNTNLDTLSMVFFQVRRDLNHEPFDSFQFLGGTHLPL